MFAMLKFRRHLIKTMTYVLRHGGGEGAFVPWLNEALAFNIQAVALIA